MHDYWSAGRAYHDPALAEITDGLVSGWLMFLWSVGVAAAAAVVVHLVVALLLGASSTLVQTIGVIAIAGLAAWIVSRFVWPYWRLRREPTHEAPYAAALLASAVAIVVSAQAFAAFTVYLAERGVAEGEPTLLSAEESYAWHLLDAVPFLEITGTLGWAEPDVLQDSVSGALMLAFAIAIIGPAIRLGFSLYHLLEKLRRDGAEAKPWFAFGRDRITPTTASLGLVVGLPIAGALYLLASYLFDSGSRPNRRLDGLVPDDVEIPAARVSTTWAADLSDRLPDHVSWSSVDVPLAWVATLPQWALAALFLWGVSGPFVIAFLIDVTAVGPRWHLVGPLGAYGCLVLIVMELWSATTLVLLHSELISTDSALPAGEELRSTMAYYAWHTADAIPALDIPQTLNWSLGHEYVGDASAGILLAFKIAFLTILAFPIMRVVRSASAGEGPPPVPREPALLAAQRYTAALGDIQEALDAAEAGAGRQRRRTASASGEATAAAASSRLEDLGSALADVERHFGPSEIVRAADAAARAADQRLELIDAAPGKPTPKKALAAARDRLAQAANAYRTTAVETVRHAESDQPPPR